MGQVETVVTVGTGQVDTVVPVGTGQVETVVTVLAWGSWRP